MDKLYKTIRKSVVVLLFFILTLYAVIQARMLLYPLTIAVLLSFFLYPIADWIEKKGIHRIAANLFTILLSVIIIGGVFYLFYSQFQKLLADLPELKEQASSNIKDTGNWIASFSSVSSSELNHWLNEQISSAFEAGSKFFGTVFTATTGTVASIAIMPVYIFCLLYYRDKIHDFIFMICPESEYPRGPEVVRKISNVTNRYMAGVFTVVLILCVINTAGLYVIGLKFALLFGILSAFCNFIPYFGTILGAAFPLLMAVFTSNSPKTAFWVIILFIIVQFTENNILTPNITGGNVQINPFVTILSIISGGLVWGVPGMFAVVPFMGVIKILLESNPETKPIAFLIGPDGTEKHSLHFKKIRSLFSKKVT